jgi:NAD(P)-dependent dehydrogenase (short-subunit alcohol dehydrogenase family)
MDIDEWEETLAINARGTFVVAREVASAMLRHNSAGSIVLLSSVAAVRGDAVEPCSAYSASKGAVSALVRRLAVEWGKADIRVNGVMPGVIDTTMTTLVNDAAATAQFLEYLPLSRLGRAEEVAAACMFLIGPNSTYITGTEIVVDGGYLAS